MIRLMVLISFIIVSCGEHNPSNTNKSNCDVKLDSIIESFDSHLCYLFNLYDEQCIGSIQGGNTLRITIWDDREENEILSLKGSNNCVIVTDKIIPSHSFNAFGILIEGSPVEYSVKKNMISGTDLLELADEARMLFNKKDSKYDKRLYVIDIKKSDEWQRLYESDVLNEAQMGFIIKLRSKLAL